MKGPALATVRKFFPAVKEVHDAEKDLVVEVTKRDQTAVKKDHSGCALAVVCKREEHADGVIISVQTAYVIKGTIATRYTMTELATRELVSFDRGAGFGEGTYTLKRPRPARRLGSKGGPHGKKPYRSKREQHVTKNIRTTLRAA